MSYTETFTSDVQYLPKTVWQKPCSGWQYTDYRNVLLSYSSKQKRDVDSREKPEEEDLVWNPTIRERVRDYEVTFGKVSFIRGRTTDFGCPDWRTRPKYPIVDTHYVDPLINFSEASVDFPDYILPMRLKIKDGTINLGATVAEYRQSVRMFGSAARGIVDAIRSIRKLKFAKKRSLCSITNAHLIHDYGIAPLMSDVYDTVEALRLRLERPIYKRFYVKRKNKGTQTFENTQSSSYTGYGKATTVKTVKSSCYVEMDVEKAALFTLGNPAEILWEITPFSFVVDWMIPVGDWLISLDALKAVKRLSGTVTEIGEVHTTTRCVGTDYDGNPFWSNPDGKHYGRSHERKTYNSLPLPPFPKIDVRDSINTLFNAVSLLISVRGCKGVMPRFKRGDF